MSEVAILREHESDGGWSFTVRVGRGSSDSLHTLTLSWVDHEHWTHGSVAPSRTAEAVMRVALSHTATLPERVDAARLTREIEGFSGLLREALGGS